MNKLYIPSYQECVRITQENENFYEKKTQVNGVNVSIFNYRLATAQDFFKPLKDSDEIQASELRGITFIHAESGVERYLMLHKFFNLDQTEGYLYSQVKHKKIVRIQDKADGSMIRFLRVNNVLVAKTKGEFITQQAAMAMDVVSKNSRLKSFIEKTLDQNLAAIFELTSFANQIVLNYSKTELQLLQLREESTGKYLDIYNHELVKTYNVLTATNEELESLESLVAKKPVVEGREGWIVTMDDSQMLKIKTQWYMDRHGLLTSSMVRENDLVNLILTETLDDAMAMIVEGDPRRKYAESLQKALAVYMERALKSVTALVASYNGSKKDFALANKSHEWFAIAVRFVDAPDEEKAFKFLKERVLFQNRNLMEAKSFVKNVLGVEPVSFVVDDDT